MNKHSHKKDHHEVNDFDAGANNIKIPLKIVFIHETVIIEENVEILQGTKIWMNSQLRKNVKIGKNCIIGKDTYIDVDVEIGDGCKIQNGVYVYKGVEIEQDVFLGPNVTFTNDKFPRAFIDNWEVKKTKISKGVSIGANATILCGVTLGEYCMVGAGSVVTKSFPPFSLVVGNPAKVIALIDKEGNRVMNGKITILKKIYLIINKFLGNFQKQYFK